MFLVECQQDDGSWHKAAGPYVYRARAVSKHESLKAKYPDESFRVSEATAHKVVARKQKPPQCIKCREHSADGVYDCYGRFWCEDCVIFILGDMDPGRG